MSLCVHLVKKAHFTLNEAHFPERDFFFYLQVKSFWQEAGVSRTQSKNLLLVTQITILRRFHKTYTQIYINLRMSYGIPLPPPPQNNVSFYWKFNEQAKLNV